jgi:2-hydroxycyclohexanecarboxyl-CoA dehydrogenase
MELELTDRVVVISGGASNIGRRLSLAFADEGAQVTIADIDDAQAEKVAAEAHAGRIRTEHCDVTDEDSVRATVDATIAAHGRIDVLVNCAGWTVDRLFRDKPRSEWEKEIAIDFWGFINFTRATLDHMVEAEYGRIVSIGSDAGRIGEWREAVYSGTKAGVIAMSKAIAKEVGRHNITLNVVCPGFTPGTARASGAHSVWSTDQGDQFSDETLAKIAKGYPLRRLGTPEDLVGPVLLLASDRASYITGQTLSVSGGYTMI